MAIFMQMSSGGFPFGLDWSKNAEAIQDGALVQAEQCEYDYSDGALRTVEGVTIKFDATVSVDSLFYDKTNDVYLFSNGTSLYKTNLITKTLLGNLTGSSKPVYCDYGGNILIASGGKLQVVTGGNSLSTITDSPAICSSVTSFMGRVIAFSTASDLLSWSAIGDYTSWTNVPADTSSGQSANIGYKDPGNLIALSFLGKAMIAYKQSGRAYQIIDNPGETSSFAILPLSETASCLSKNAALAVDDRSYYLGRSGFMSFVPTDTYSNIQPTESGLNVNAWLAKNIDENCQMWHVQPNKQIWIKSQNDKRIYLYHYIPRFSDGRGAFTTRTFINNVNDVCCVGNSVYIAYGNKIGMLDDTTDLDDATQIQTSILGNNKLTKMHSILVMNQNFVSSNILSGYGTIKCGKKPRNITFSAEAQVIYGNATKIYSNTTKIYSSAYTRLFKVGGGSNRNVQLSIIVQKGRISLRQFDYQYLEV